MKKVNPKVASVTSHTVLVVLHSDLFCLFKSVLDKRNEDSNKYVSVILAKHRQNSFTFQNIFCSKHFSKLQRFLFSAAENRNPVKLGRRD